MKRLKDKAAVDALRQRLADIDGLNAEGVAAGERRQRAEATIARLTEQHHGILAERVELHDAPDPDRVERLLSGDEPAPAPDDDTAQRDAHNRQVARRAARVDQDIALVRGEVGKCETRETELAEQIAESWRDFHAALADALADEVKREVEALVDRLLTPLAVTIDKSGHRRGYGNARAIMDSIQIEDSYGRWNTAGLRQLWPQRWPVRSATDGSEIDTDMLARDLVAEIGAAK